ncbi:MAG: hypothetical protein HKN59_04290 [Gammaproteobacteria bacterium]|nr:hypothetical protein [Gammaproteobacteria bacterium]
MEGTLSAAAMPRVAELLSDSVTGEVRVSLTFSRNRKSVILVEGLIDGTLPVICQRCLEEYDWHLNHRFRLAISDSLASGRQAPPGLELIEWVGDSIVPAQLVEEEILLTMPLVPVHSDESGCNALSGSVSDGGHELRVDKQADSDAAGEKARPFAGLADWLPAQDKSD